jgi:hypothetical protein
VGPSLTVLLGSINCGVLGCPFRTMDGRFSVHPTPAKPTPAEESYVKAREGWASPRATFNLNGNDALAEPVA